MLYPEDCICTPSRPQQYSESRQSDMTQKQSNPRGSCDSQCEHDRWRLAHKYQTCGIVVLALASSSAWPGEAEILISMCAPIRRDEGQGLRLSIVLKSDQALTHFSTCSSSLRFLRGTYPGDYRPLGPYLTGRKSSGCLCTTDSIDAYRQSAMQERLPLPTPSEGSTAHASAIGRTDLFMVGAR